MGRKDALTCREGKILGALEDSLRRKAKHVVGIKDIEPAVYVRQFVHSINPIARDGPIALHVEFQFFKNAYLRSNGYKGVDVQIFEKVGEDVIHDIAAHAVSNDDQLWIILVNSLARLGELGNDILNDWPGIGVCSSVDEVRESVTKEDRSLLVQRGTEDANESITGQTR